MWHTPCEVYVCWYMCSGGKYVLVVLCCLLQERDLNLQSEGIKMTVASEQPHLLGVDDDPLSTGLVLYHLKVCCYSMCRSMGMLICSMPYLLFIIYMYINARFRYCNLRTSDLLLYTSWWWCSSFNMHCFLCADWRHHPRSCGGFCL